MPDIDNKTTWPGWETVRLIGRGSFGAVYEIERNNYGHKEKAALKVISIPQSASDIDDLVSDGYDEQSITSRFEGYMQDIVREYSMMADMKGCANIVYCDDWKSIQHDDGMGWDIFIKMELLTALPRTLGKTITDEQVIKIGMDICNALAFCESRNLLHRDIKPQNIFVAPDGTYKLGDFGIAKTAERTTSGTKTGTYKYMAPEVYNNQPYGGKADIYSLGLVLYWLLNERRTPFLPLPPSTPTSTEEDRARTKRFNGEPIPAPAHGSKELQRIVLKACAFDQRDRYQNAEEMLQELSQIQGSHGSSKNTDSNNSGANGISGNTDGLFSQTDERVDTASSDKTKSEDSTVSAYHISTGKSNENDEKTVGAFSSKHSEKREPSIKTKKQKNPAKIIIGALAAIVACVLLVVFLRGISDNTGTQASQEASGKWVLVRSTDYYRGELTSQVEYQYGEHGRSAIIFVYYDTYNDTETRQHIVYEFDQSGNRVKAISYDLSSNEMTQYTEYIRDQNGDLTESRTYSAGGVLIGNQEALPAEARHDVTLKSYRYENGVQSLESEDVYDHDGNLVKQTYFDSDGSPFFISEYSYDENGLRIKETTSFYFLGQLNDRTETTMEYDDAGKLIRDVSISQGTGKTTIGEYIYDDHGNNIRYISTCDGEEQSRTEDEYAYYENGAIVGDGIDSLDQENLSTSVVLNPTIVDGQRIVVHRSWVLGLTNNGNVLVAGGDNSFGSNMVSDWTDIVAIDAAVNGDMKTILGLKRDGTVVSAGWNLSGKGNVSDWSDIVQIEAVISNSYGLRSDGTIVAAGSNSYGDCEVDNITNGAKIYTQEHSSNCLLVVNRDGTVEATGNQNRFANVSLASFKSIDDLCLGWSELYGVTSEGKVVSIYKLPDEIAQWTDIKKVYSHYINSSLVIGLRTNGTIVAYTENNYHGENEIVNVVKGWTDIRDIVILSDYSDFEAYTVIGVKKDGSLVSTGGIDLTGFDNIAELYVYDDDYTDFAYLVGVRNDGTVICNDPAVADTVSKWDLF